MPDIASNLPLSIDVNVEISLAQTEIATDMTMACLLTPGVTWPSESRLRFYNDLAAFTGDTGVSTSGTYYEALVDFFSQQPRPQQVAVARVFTASVPADPVTGATISSFTAAQAFTTGNLGSLTIAQAGQTTISLTSIDFATTAGDTAAHIAATLNAATGHGAGSPWSASSSKLVYTPTLPGAVTVTSSKTGFLAAIGLTAPVGGSAGYTYTSFADELAQIRAAAIDAGHPIFGWGLDSVYRDTGVAQATLAATVLASGMMQVAAIETNDPQTIVNGDTTSISANLYLDGNNATFGTYSNDVQHYPSMSILALMLAVDYTAANTAITAKFKNLPGVPTCPVSQTDLDVITATNCNVFTAVGNNARTYREGTTYATGWWIDNYINLCNFKNDLQTAVYNVFLQNGKVPYTTAGQLLLVDACNQICQQYTLNGVFAPRQVEDLTTKQGFSILPAYQCVPMPIYTASASNRAARIGPPIQITAYLAGAIHQVNVEVNVIQ